MPLLYYWRWDNYIRDRAFGFGYHLNQNSAAMLQVQPGDSLWAFTRREPDKQYVLAAEMVVRAVIRNSPNYRYGAYLLPARCVSSASFLYFGGPILGVGDMTIEQVEAEVLKLPRPVRARLAEALISSLDEDSEIEQAWEDEAERRYQRYLNGEEEAIPAEQALAEIRAELRR